MPAKFPLQWPKGRERTRPRDRKRLGGDATFGVALSRLLYELRLAGVALEDDLRTSRVVISSNVPLRLDGLPRADRGEPEDPGVAIYFRFEDLDVSFASDTYDSVRDNVRALALSIEAIRGLRRWGTSDVMHRTFRGFAALPEKATSPWRETLGFKKDEVATIDAIESKFRDLVKVHHPDYGGNEETFRQIVEARSIARRETQQKP